jgi:peptidoglycan hydrolase-like protein with peptidoglycan-binding domain
MNITANNVASKLFVAFVASAMLFTLATPAKAATAEELQAQIDALMAQIAALKGDTATTPVAPKAGCTFTRPLTLGSEGADVKCLQDAMTPKYFTNAGGSTGYFGPVTKAAVAAWQTANGVMPAAGYFGPVSQAKFAEVVATTPDTDDSDDTDDTDSADLGDGEGDIEVSAASADDSDIEEGGSGEVYAFDVEVEGDVEINRVDVYMEVVDSTSGSEDADDYFAGATLW